MTALLEPTEPGNEWWWRAIEPLFHRSAQHDRGLKTDAELIAATKEFAESVRQGFETVSSAPQEPDDDALIEELRCLSSSLGEGLAENESDPMKLIERIWCGLERIQRVEAQRTADLIEELSKTPRTTWGEVKSAVLARAGLQAKAPETGEG